MMETNNARSGIRPPNQIMKTTINLRQLTLILLWGLLCGSAIVNAAEVNDLRTEYRTNPLGIDAGSPRLSWIIDSEHRGEIQTAYQILVASSSKLVAADKGDLWDCGKVVSEASTQVEYAGKPLESQAACFWKVRVWRSRPRHALR
jgi:alpha-L-rhamnosidase